MAKGRKKHFKSHDFEESKDQEQEESENFLDEVVPKWYDQVKNDGPGQWEPITEEELSSLRAEADQILQEETSHYHSKERKGKSGHDAAWLKTMLTKGTSKDKIGAHILSVQNAPQFNLSQLYSLVNMVKTSKQRDCISVMENLVDLFLEDLLIPDRKLKTFDKQPLSKLNDLTSGCARARKNKLLLWIFEEKLKECYQTFISSIDAVAKDTVEANRMKAVTVMNRLLSGHPEQEQFLLKNIINKLGDPNQKVVSKVIYNLTQLLRVHPNMKQVVLNEVEKFLFRPNLNKKAQYYSICFLTQYVFQGKDRDIARNIINIYFSFFKAAIKKGEIDSKLMGALLVGVRRAHPFAKLTPEIMREHTDTLYKLVHLTPFNISVHALCLLQEVSTQSDDRFYSALYKKLLDPDISKSCHQAIFINLLYKAIIKDSNIARIKAMIKRLLQVCLSVPSPLACAFLYLISQLLSKRRQLLAFQTIPQYILPTIKVEDDDDGDEKYFDVEEPTDNNDKEGLKDEIKEEIEDKDKGRLSPRHENNEDINIKEESIETDSNAQGWVFKNLIKQRKTSLASGVYDPYARNPLFSNADKSAYFELISLSQHFHPSVALFAHKIFTSEKIVYSGDPLADFTLVRFLDRFCFKNPKKFDDELKGPDPTLAQRKYYKPSGVKSIPVLSQSYLSQSRTNIPVDELFLYKYLKDKHGSGEKFSKKKDDDDNDSVASEDFEELIQGMMGGKKTKHLDYMEDVGDNLKKKKGAKEKQEEDISDDDEEAKEGSDEDDSDAEESVDEDAEVEQDENNASDDGDAMDFEDGIDGEAIDFSDDGDDDDEIDLDNEFFNKEDSFKMSSNKNKKEKLKNTKKVKGLKTKGGLDSLFAPAEEFAEILEEAGASKEKPGMIQSLSNTDNSAPKQLAWETKRDRWVRDLDSRKRKHKNYNNSTKFNKSNKRKKNF